MWTVGASLRTMNSEHTVHVFQQALSETLERLENSPMGLFMLWQALIFFKGKRLQGNLRLWWASLRLDKLYGRGRCGCGTLQQLLIILMYLVLELGKLTLGSFPPPFLLLALPLCPDVAIRLLLHHGPQNTQQFSNTFVCLWLTPSWDFFWRMLSCPSLLSSWYFIHYLLLA